MKLLKSSLYVLICLGLTISSSAAPAKTTKSLMIAMLRRVDKTTPSPMGNFLKNVDDVAEKKKYVRLIKKMGDFSTEKPISKNVNLKKAFNETFTEMGNDHQKMKEFLDAFDDITKNTKLDEAGVRTLIRQFGRGANLSHRFGAVGEVLSYKARTPDSNQIRIGGKQGPDWGKKIGPNGKIQADSILIESKATSRQSYLTNSSSTQFQRTMIRVRVRDQFDSLDEFENFLKQGKFHLDITWRGTGGIDKAAIVTKFHEKLKKLNTYDSKKERVKWSAMNNSIDEFITSERFVIEQVN